MKIYLSQEEVNAAVAAYVPELGIDVTGKDVNVNLDVDDDGEAEVVVTIQPHTEILKSVPIRRKRRSKAEMEAAKAQPEELTEDEFNNMLPDDDVKEDHAEPDEDEILESVAVPEAPIEDSEEEEPKASTSLFD